MTPAVFLTPGERVRPTWGAGLPPRWRSDWWLLIGFWVVVPVAGWAGILTIVWLW